MAPKFQCSSNLPKDSQGRTDPIRRFETKDSSLTLGTQREFRLLLERGEAETPTHLFLAVALIRLGGFTEAFDHLMAGYKLEIEGAESGPFPLT